MASSVSAGTVLLVENPLVASLTPADSAAEPAEATATAVKALVDGKGETDEERRRREKAAELALSCLWPRGDVSQSMCEDVNWQREAEMLWQRMSKPGRETVDALWRRSSERDDKRKRGDEESKAWTSWII